MSKIDILPLFLDKFNVSSMSWKIYSKHMKERGRKPLTWFQAVTPKHMKKWAKQNELYLQKYKPLVNYTFDALRFANDQFLKYAEITLGLSTSQYTKKVSEHKYSNATPDWNPMRGQLSELDKLHSQLTFNDMRRLNLWVNERTWRTCDNFRWRNRIPSYEIGLYKRHYERDVKDTLRDRQLENPSRKQYNMDDIYKTRGRAWGRNPYGRDDYNTEDALRYSLGIFLENSPKLKLQYDQS